ncbi:MAG: hypothetical protein V3R80_09705 [Candidatus Tectomicrobia bacterium]
MNKGLPIVSLLVVVSVCGCTRPQALAIHPQVLLDQMEIGKTSLQEVERQVGKPTAVHVSSGSGSTRESWAYGYARMGTNPARYIPFLGALAVADVADVEPWSFAVSFSEQGAVEGFTQRKLARYVIEPAWPGRAEEVTPYGVRNLNTRLGLTGATNY